MEPIHIKFRLAFKLAEMQWRNVFNTATAIGLSASIVAVLAGCSKTPTSAVGPAPIPVRFETLQPETLEDFSEFVGSLAASEKAEIRSQIQGRIREMLVEPGQAVEAGQALMVLEPDHAAPQFEAAQAAVSVAESARSAAVEQLRVAEANRATAASQVELAETNFGRASFLLEAGAIGQFDFDRAEQDLDARRNSLDAATNQVEAARAAISQAEASVAQARSQANSAQVDVGFKTITAPIAGILGDMPVKLGDYVSTGQTVGAIARNAALDLRLSVPANRSRQLRTGLPVELIDPATKERVAIGSVSFIAPTVDPSSQVILAKARFPNTTGTLRDGQYVQARVIWSTAPGLLIPTIAVSRQSGRNFVFIADQVTTEAGETQSIVRLHPVELGALQDANYQVVDGLKPGDQVAASNILKLQDGVPVQPES